MTKALLAILLFVATANSYGDCRKIPYVSERPKIVNREDEIKSTDLVWQSSSIPPEILKLIKTDIKVADFSSFDLDGNGIDELLISNNNLGGSGGRGFVFLEKQSGKWKVIAKFTGGFILNNRWTPTTYNPKYLTMTVWSRTGAAETWQDLYAYKNNKYKMVNSQQVPLTVLYSKDFQEMLLNLNTMCWERWN
ncbi:hypothetical protein MCEMHM7_01071 [Candidatus Methylopumilus planktonicus]|uniref:hypothetical protein n=1 Tax=Candidatus Methylopumilus planktonicus TaxID=1581557 RepID=UPI003BEF449F